MQGGGIHGEARRTEHGTTEYTELQPLLSGVHSVMRVKSVLYGALCPQINNSKLCTLRQISKGKLKAVKKLSIG
jgi:hypothetical protein